MANGNEYLYNKIDDLLAQKNMSRRQLAKAIDVPPTTLQSAFEKKSNISIERLKKILAVLDARYEDVYPPEQLSAAIIHNIKYGLEGDSSKDAWSEGAQELHTPAWEKARRAFYELPNDWQKDTAINWQIEILHKKMPSCGFIRAMIRFHKSLQNGLNRFYMASPQTPTKNKAHCAEHSRRGVCRVS